MKITKQDTSITDGISKQGRSSDRQVSATLARTAFWSSLVMTLLLANIAIVLKVTSGIVVIPLIIAAIVGLVGTILLAIKNRWTTLVATLLETYLLISIWTAPFVVADLSDPKGQMGGLGHFFGDALAACSVILAFACSLGTTVQYFWNGSRQTPRWYTVVLNLVIGFTIGVLLMGAVALPPSTATGLTTTNGIPTVHMNATTFLQPTVTIAKGQKLLLVDDVAVEHDLFNGSWQNGSPQVAQEPGAPKLNDVKVNNNSVTIGPFTVAGTYHIFCTLHSGMNLTVVVQ